MKPLKVFLGYDTNEPLAYQVASFSIIRRSSKPVEVRPLVLSDLDMIIRPIEMRGKQMWCPISDAPMSTQFSNSRFIIPFITKGWALFADDDIVCLDDISHLFDHADPKYAVMVVKHKHEPVEEFFPDGRKQTVYPRKNWSSVVLWNCDHPAHKRFTLEDLNSWPGRDMHRFIWLEDDEIGELPLRWNFLIGVNEWDHDVSIAHYTLGGPWLPKWEKTPEDFIWRAELNDMIINGE